MRFYYVSDLHLEFDTIDSKLLAPPAEDRSNDVLILAGDIAPWQTHKMSVLKMLWCVSKSYHHVIYIPGNHEFYHGILSDVLFDLEETLSIEFTNVTMLNNTSIRIDDVYIFGSVFWTDINWSDPVAALQIQRSLADFQCIRTTPNAVLRPLDTYDFNIESTNAYLKFMKDNQDVQKKIVVTHHVPTMIGLQSKYIGSPLNYAFRCTHLDDHLMLGDGPAYWIHGHTHIADTMILGNTHVLCNPKGYPGEISGFDPTRCFEFA